MGGSKKYIESGGFTEYEYEQIGTTANGIKIIKPMKAGSVNTPMKSNTPNTSYALVSNKSNLVKQITSYKGRDKFKDIGIEHIHKNPQNGKLFKATGIHVHEYINGERQGEARRPSKKEKRLLMFARYKGMI